MASQAYWVAGAAVGLIQGCSFAVEQIVPGGTCVTRRILSGFDKQPLQGKPRPLEDVLPSDQDANTCPTAADNNQAHPSSSRAHEQAGPPASPSGRRLQDQQQQGGGQHQSPQRSQQQRLASPSPSSPSGPQLQMRVPRLKLTEGGSKVIVAARTDRGSGPTAGSLSAPFGSQLSAANVEPLGAAYDRERGGRAAASAASLAVPGLGGIGGAGGSIGASGGAGRFGGLIGRGGGGNGGGGGAGGLLFRDGDDDDALTTVTMNRYTYAWGLGETGMPSASTPATPRSEATSDGALGGGRRRKQQALFKGLRRKGQKPNQQVR